MAHRLAGYIMSFYIITIGVILCLGLVVSIIIIKQKNKIQFLKTHYSELNLDLEILKKEIDEYQKKEKSIDQFFSIITHDLRGPIGNTASILKTIIENPEIYDEATTNEIMVALKESSKNTMELLNTLSQWSRIRRDKINTNIEPFSVVDLVDNAILSIEHKAKTKNISIKTTYNSPSPSLSSDMVLCSAMLQHLLTNAIKFSHEGSEILLFVTIKDNALEFHVEDNGVGIAEQDKHRVLDLDNMFFTYGTKNEKGPGLGLIIVQEYCKLVNGKVWFTSKQGQGSDFYILLPNIVA